MSEVLIYMLHDNSIPLEIILDRGFPCLINILICANGENWTSFFVGVSPLIFSILKSVDSYILYYSCALVAVIIATVRLFVKEKTIRNMEEEKDRLNKILSKKWDNWGDDEFSKNPEAWETLKKLFRVFIQCE